MPRGLRRTTRVRTVHASTVNGRRLHSPGMPFSSSQTNAAAVSACQPGACPLRTPSTSVKPPRAWSVRLQLSVSPFSQTSSACVCYSLHRVYFELVTVYNVLDVACRLYSYTFLAYSALQARIQLRRPSEPARAFGTPSSGSTGTGGRPRRPTREAGTRLGTPLASRSRDYLNGNPRLNHGCVAGPPPGTYNSSLYHRASLRWHLAGTIAVGRLRFIVGSCMSVRWRCLRCDSLQRPPEEKMTYFSRARMSSSSLLVSNFGL